MISFPSHWNKAATLYTEQERFDEQCRQYEEIARLAKEAGLIRAASGGVIILLHPTTQLECGDYHRIQYMTGNTAHCHELKPAEA